MMHCWLIAKIEVDDIPYVALRGINWRNEYKDEGRFANIGGGAPWVHVPSVKFPYRKESPAPRLLQALDRAVPLIRQDWPALGAGKIVHADQSIRKAEVEADAQGRAEDVTRIAIDLGKRRRLPKVLIRPGRKLPWPRQATPWVKVDDIKQILNPRQAGVAREMTTETGSLFVVRRGRQIPMETGHGIRQVDTRDLLLQASVVETLTDVFGLSFPKEHSPSLHSALRVRPSALAKPGA
jgi:hypothetical protein